MAQMSQNGTHYTLEGRHDAPVVVLIHGLGLHQGIWVDFVPHLVRRYRVLNYDLFGHGRSVKSTKAPTLSVLAMQLRELLDELGIRCATLVGFSLGGMINRRFATDYPAYVAALAIFNSPHERGAAQQKRVEQRATQSDEGGIEATIDATIERWFTPGYRQRHPQAVERVRRWVLDNDLDSYRQYRWVLANGVVELISLQPPIQKPVLIVTCENDSGSTPTMSYAISDKIEQAQVLIVPHLQHMGLLEQPSAFIEPLMTFLSKHAKLGDRV